ncbi:PAC2 family protein [Demequina sp. NBRC 110055]|uniref:PAC2 family protein n=1 Tax=Demequina sp. NBRC 110055 TaxID=1570344 RepID=UPI000A01676C|nr:PAC2 family protein [Demequina sp. NBRC 110055]
MDTEDQEPTLGSDETVMLAAFEGWNDAGSAASQALDHLATWWDARDHAALDPEDYHDFQVSRPTITRGPSGDRVVSWPGTVLSTARPEGGPAIVLARGIEPSMRWRTFCAELLDHAEDLGVTTIVTVGALLVDVPHTRPLPTFVTSEDEDARERFGLERSDYEGPTGIVGVLGHEAQLRGITVLSLWVGVPHYIAHPPSPKASAALLTQLERLIGVTIDLGDLPDESEAWQRGADELAEDDEEIADHVRQLESVMDETSLPEASGDAIAAEFEQFLRRRGDGGMSK